MDKLSTKKNHYSFEEFIVQKQLQRKMDRKYWTFCIVILDCGLKLHNLSIHTLVMLQKWLEIH